MVSQEIVPTEQLKVLAQTGKAPGVDTFPPPGEVARPRDLTPARNVNSPQALDGLQDRLP